MRNIKTKAMIAALCASLLILGACAPHTYVRVYDGKKLQTQLQGSAVVIQKSHNMKALLLRDSTGFIEQTFHRRTFKRFNVLDTVDTYNSSCYRFDPKIWHNTTTDLQSLSKKMPE